MILTICANPSVDSVWHINKIAKGTINRSDKESFYPGGKGVHVAFALNELERNTTTLGIWGGQTGEWLKRECAKNGISAIGPSVKQWSRLCIILQSAPDWNETEFLGSGPKVKACEVKNFVSLYQKFIEINQPEAVVISGSIPQGFDKDIYRRLISMAKIYEIPSFLDASGKLLENSLEANPFLVHINHHEGEELCGVDDPIQIVRWLSNYCKIPAVTAGADGLYLLVNKQIFHATCQIDSSRIVNTVGSGDCLLAGICLATLDYADPAFWARYATACGSANCINPDLGMLKAADVSKLLNKVKLNRFDIL